MRMKKIAAIALGASMAVSLTACQTKTAAPETTKAPEATEGTTVEAVSDTHLEVYKRQTYNSCYVNKGCVLTKYTGARGKSGSSDAGAELMAKVIKVMEDAGCLLYTSRCV